MPRSVAPGPTARLHQLDGLRGVAALVVVVFHFLCAFAPRFAVHQGHPLAISDGTAIGAFLSGPFAVFVFFVLSGVVVSGSAARRRDGIVLSVVLRYLRLALPAAASTVLAWYLLTLLPDAAATLDRLAPSPWLQWTHQGVIPPLHEAIYDGLVGIFRTGGSSFDNVLWTMRIEFVGSVMLYLAYGLTEGRTRLALLLGCGLLAAATGRYAYDAFVLGAFLRDAHASGRLAAVAPGRLFAVGIALGAATSYWTSAGTGVNGTPIDPVAAALIVYGCMRSPGLARWLASASCRALGRISFSLYLVHVPLLYTVVAAASLRIWPLGMPELLALAALYGGSALILAIVWTRLVDEPVLDANAALRQRVALRRRSPPDPTGTANPVHR